MPVESSLNVASTSSSVCGFSLRASAAIFWAVVFSSAGVEVPATGVAGAFAVEAGAGGTAGVGEEAALSAVPCLIVSRRPPRNASRNSLLTLRRSMADADRASISRSSRHSLKRSLVSSSRPAEGVVGTPFLSTTVVVVFVVARLGFSGASAESASVLTLPSRPVFVLVSSPLNTPRTLFTKSCCAEANLSCPCKSERCAFRSARCLAGAVRNPSVAAAT